MVDSHSTALRFTPDGTRLLISKFKSYRSFLSIFTVGGSFVCTLGHYLFATSPNIDVAFGSGSEIIVADFGGNCICVLPSAADDSVVHSWDSRDAGYEKFESPAALAVSGPYLFVLDAFGLHAFQ